METFLIAGLGNPDKRYENTRHNAGFMAADRLAGLLGVAIAERKFSGLAAAAYRGGKKYVLLKPQTYMNLSGLSVAQAAAYYDIGPDHIVVLCDDINLSPARIRVRPYGSAGGHNGLKSIIEEMGTDRFPRVRIGVGLNETETADGEKVRTDLAAHVLSKLTQADRTLMEPAFIRAAEAALSLCEEGADAAMNRFNR